MRHLLRSLPIGIALLALALFLSPTAQVPVEPSPSPVSNLALSLVSAPVASATGICDPDCDDVHGTACSPNGATMQCWLFVRGNCRENLDNLQCGCSGGVWICP